MVKIVAYRRPFVPLRFAFLALPFLGLPFFLALPPKIPLYMLRTSLLTLLLIRRSSDFGDFFTKRPFALRGRGDAMGIWVWGCVL